MSATSQTDHLTASLREARRALDALLADGAALERLAGIPVLLSERLSAGRKVLVCGNGGSACDAAHFAEELTGRFRQDRPALAAIACTDAGHITCAANDFGFEHVFSRWVEALGQKGDVLVVLSTSGNSANIIRALGTARARGLLSLGLLGMNGGKTQALCDHAVVVPGETSDRIQELHMLILHAWVAGVERVMFGNAPRRG